MLFELVSLLGVPAANAIYLNLWTPFLVMLFQFFQAHLASVSAAKFTFITLDGMATGFHVVYQLLIAILFLDVSLKILFCVLLLNLLLFLFFLFLFPF